MLLNTNNDKQITNIDSDSFTVGNSSAIFTLMTDKLYSDKPLAALRETLSNAIDATQASLAFGQTPEKATLVAAVNGTGFDVTVTDNGIGMTAKTIKTVYSDLFTSTKSSDNSQTGGFGIGALAIFAVADKFTITTRHESDKKASVYVVHKDETGLPQISKIAETSRIRGTTVSFYMPSIPMDAARTITLTAFFNREYCASKIDLRGGYSSKITGLHGATGAANIQKIKMRGEDFHINEIAHNVFATGKTLSDLAISHYYGLKKPPQYVVIGSNIVAKTTSFLPECYALANIGDLSLTPNREQFEKTVKNDAALVELPKCPINEAAYDLGPTDFKSFMYDCNPKIYGSAVISIASSAVSATNECKAFKPQSYIAYSDTIDHLNIYAIPNAVKYDDCYYPENCYTMRMNKNASTSQIIDAIKKALVEHSEHLHTIQVTINTDNMGLKPKKTKSAKPTRITPFLYPDEPKPKLNRGTIFVTEYNIDYQSAKYRLDKLKKLYPDEFGHINPVIRADSYTGPNNIVNSIRGILINMTPEKRVRAYVFDERQFATVAIEALNFNHEPRLYSVINRATDEIFLDEDDISHHAKKAFNKYIRGELKKPTNEMFNCFFRPKNKFHTTKPNKTVIRSALIIK